MAQFSCQGVSLPGSEENQGRKTTKRAGTRPCTHGDGWARPLWDGASVSSRTREICAQRCVELPCSSATSRLPPAPQAGREAGILALLFSLPSQLPGGWENAGAAPPRQPSLVPCPLCSPQPSPLLEGADSTATPRLCVRLRSTSSTPGLSQHPQERTDPQLSPLHTTRAHTFCPSQS